MPTLCDDDLFGPVVQSADCRGGFDFTVLFEESILTILPAACFILLVPFRVLRLVKRSLRLRRNALHGTKLAAIGTYTALQVAALVLTATRPPAGTHGEVSTASASLSLACALTLLILSHLEHTKSVRPSSLISVYLLATVVFDIARVRTQWLGRSHGSALFTSAQAGLLTASLALKCVIFGLEAVEKRSLLLGLDRRFSKESTSGLLSSSVFWWLNTLLVSGFRRVLTMEDLPVIYEKLDSAVLAARLDAVWDKCDQKRKHALAWACVLSLRWEVLAIFVPRLLYTALTISQVYLIKDAVAFVQGAGEDNKGYGLVGGFALVYVGLAITMGWWNYLTYRLMTAMRGQLVSTIYSKMLTLPTADANGSSAMSLMGTDVQKIAETFHYILVQAIPQFVEVVVAMYLLYLQLGAVCIAPLLIIVITFAISILLASKVTASQGAWLELIQRRINFTSAILGSMRSVKMLGLETQMATNIEDIRTREIESSKSYRKLLCLNVALVNLPQEVSSFFVFAAYAIASHIKGESGMSVLQAITSLAVLSLLTGALGSLLWAVHQGWSAMGCFARIQTYLLETTQIDPRQTGSNQSGSDSAPELDGEIELVDTKQVELVTHMTAHHHHPSEITVTQGAFGWSPSGPAIVHDVNIALTSGLEQFTILVGPVGCGKSTLLKGLLGETAVARGTVRVSAPEIAFCDQTPWIINGSVRANIVAESEPFDAAWYETVCRACALDVDLRQLPAGDATIVGSKGVKLSGGQKQRISMARAVYARTKLAVFDDVLSGLDAVTEAAVFQRVFGRDGLLCQLGTTVILATHSVKYLAQADRILVLDHQGRIVEQGKFAALNVTGSYIHDLQIELLDNSRTQGYDDETAVPAEDSTPVLPDETKAKSDVGRMMGDWTTYKYYFHALGPFYTLVFVGCVVVQNVGLGMSSIWLNWWAEDNGSENRRPLGYWLGLYGFWCLTSGGGMILAVIFMWLVMIPRSCQNMHQSILKAVSRAPLSFISGTETGVLVNRFSQDLRHIDMGLPTSLLSFGMQVGFSLAAVALSINAVGYFAAVLPLFILALYAVQKFYLRTSRQLRLLELEASAPLYSHFIETLAGLTTIRAFGWTRAYTHRHLSHLDASQKPYYLLLCTQRWLVFVLDLMVAVLAIVLVGLAVGLRERLNPGLLGVALVNMTELSNALSSLVNFYTQLETSLGAVARIKDFARDTPVEDGWEKDADVADEWPAEGEVRLETVWASYGQADVPVLKDISFSAGRHQKIGIVGRTGSGKSSSTLAILRLINIVSGRILLDGTDLATVPGPTLRERLVCLTQDPFIFPASVRSNLDPQSRSTDKAMVDALQKVGLWDVLQSKAADSSSHSSVLDTPMDGDILSHGQRQLFCLARATLKKGSVLILDEPTSSVDSKTDLRMQELIRSEFSDRTIIMIAHRISSLVDFDRVAVLDGGALVEFGNPVELLKNDNSHFAKLYNSSVSM